MKILKESNILMIIIFCYSIPMLFSLFFSGSILSIWKQFFWVIVVYVLLTNKLFFNKGYVFIYKHFWKSLFLLLFFSIVVFLFYGFNFKRIVFSVWVYLAGIPFFIYPFLIVKEKKFTAFYYLILGLSVSTITGLIVDHFTGIFNLISIAGGSDRQLLRGEFRRSSFLFESPTALVNFMNFLVVIVSIFFLNSKSKLKKIFYFILLLGFLLSSYFTGSRQVLLTTGLIIFFAFIFFLKKINFFSMLFVFASVLLFFLFYSNSDLNEIINTETGAFLIQRITDTDFSEDTRSISWAEGISQFSLFNAHYWFFGHGIGTTMGQHAVEGEKIHSHFESAVYAVFYEIGLIAFFIVFYPIRYFMKVLRKHCYGYERKMMYLYYLTAILIFFIAPGGMHFTSSMSIYILGGVVCNFEWFSEQFKNNNIV